MKLVRTIAGLLALTFSYESWGGELILQGPSYHFDRDAGYTDFTYGLGYVTDSQWAAGAYRNSIRKTSLYAGKVLELGLRFKVLAGVVTGYDHPLPMAVLNYSIPVTDKVRLHFNLVPIKKDGCINVALGLLI